MLSKHVEFHVPWTKNSQPQVPEEVVRDGFDSQLELAISTDPVDPKEIHAKFGTR